MKSKFISLVSCLMLMSLCGCVSTMIAQKTADTVAPPKADTFSFDVSTQGADTGKLNIQCRQPSYQMLVDKYAIKIDNNSPLVVSKQSDTDIKLNAGKHSLKFYAVSPKPEEVEQVAYGKATIRDIEIAKDQQQNLKYTGPYRLFGEGRVEFLK